MISFFGALSLLPFYIIEEIAELQKDKVEHNGQILWKGEELVYNHQIGQTMADCKTCEINWHTHPSDYVNLYPDHPSAIDMKYIYKVVLFVLIDQMEVM